MWGPLFDVQILVETTNNERPRFGLATSDNAHPGVTKAHSGTGRAQGAMEPLFASVVDPRIRGDPLDKVLQNQRMDFRAFTGGGGDDEHHHNPQLACLGVACLLAEKAFQ